MTLILNFYFFKLTLFKKTNLIHPFYIPSNIQIIINKIKFNLLEYERFVNTVFPTDIETVFILPANTYHTKNEYTAKINALINSIEVELDSLNNYIINDMITNINIKFIQQLEEITNTFIINIKLLNELNNLAIQESLFYSKSFTDLFKDSHLPKIAQ